MRVSLPFQEMQYILCLVVLHYLLYSLFWVIARLLNFMCRRFGTLCSVFKGHVSKKNNWDEIARVFIHVQI
jgi:hypothetical protein